MQFPLIIRAGEATRVRMTGDRGESIRLIDENTGIDELNLRVNHLLSDERGRTHQHPESDLLCYVIAGQLEVETPEQVTVLDAGDAAFIPKGMKHTMTKQGDEPLQLLEVYVPGSPEFVYD